MHIVGLNILKYYNINLSNDIIPKNYTNNMKAICDIIEKGNVHELRSGLWPYKPMETHIGYKVEEYKLFE
jgi:beta-mannanase